LIYLFKMVIFYSYVSLPEGRCDHGIRMEWDSMLIHQMILYHPYKSNNIDGMGYSMVTTVVLHGLRTIIEGIAMEYESDMNGFSFW